ncbi:MAG: multidrug efflux RND transporter permease subunit [Candidatus Eremiobacteraeota bacterium]|nr:multidrug efflux RND transporter permease subunit [Candidatus Eremiobacteraeota bacterium]
MSRFFIERPIFAIVIAIVICLAGLISLAVLPVALFPQITPPTVQVNTTYTGANASIVEQAVATNIETRVNGAPNLMYLNSFSTSNGVYTLTATFNVGSDINQDANLVQNRVQMASSSLPSAVNSYGLAVTQQSPAILMIVTLYAPDNTYDSLWLSNYATINIINNLNRVPGVGNTSLVGAGNYAMRVWLRPDSLAGLGLQANDVINALQEQNTLAPAGQLGLPPSPQGAPYQTPVNVAGLLDSTQQFDNVVLRTLSNGSVVRLRDVGHTQLAAQSYQLFSELNNTPAAAILIYQTPSANAIQAAAAVRKEMDELARSFPPGLRYGITLDTTDFVHASIRDVLMTLLEAFILVCLVVFIFLGNVRATIIPVCAVPVALIGTFAAFVPLGFSLNTLSLFGIVLAVGIVIDDAIVVVEASELHIEQGMSPKDATLKAMEEVQAPVIAVALVLTAVFVPAAFLPGIVGRLYQQFALTLSVSVLLSALVALTLTPALCATVLRPREPLHGPIGRFIDWFNGLFDRTRSRYMVVLKSAIRRTALMLVLLAFITLGAGWLLKTLPSSFVPLEDQGYFFLDVMLPNGSSLERTRATADVIAKEVKSISGVQDVVTLGGLNILNNTTQSNVAAIAVTLIPWEKRTAKSLGLANIIRTAYFQAVKHPEAKILPVPPPPIIGLGNSGGFQFMLEDRTGHTQQELAQVAARVLDAATKRPELTTVNSSYSVDYPQVDLALDRDKVRNLGIQLTDVFQTLQTMLGGIVVNNVILFNNSWKLLVQAEPQYRMTQANIGALEVRNRTGGMVPLGTFSTPSLTHGANLIQRYNVYRAAEIDGQSAPGYSSGQAIAAMEAVAKETIPQGFGYEWTGTAYQEQQAGSSQLISFVLSIMLVFLFLAALYESWAIPFGVILGIPLGVFGAFFGAWLFHLPNNVYVQIGLIMLIGLAAKNAILIVEFAKDKREKENMPALEGALEGAKVRFRPILMTSFAFIFGVAPLVIASGAGAASRHSLGTAVFFGMIFATSLGVFFIPVLYHVIEETVERGRRGRPDITVAASRARGDRTTSI